MEPIPKTIPIQDRPDPFVIEDLIGEGGMGKVYRARDPVTGELLAVKVLGAVGDPTRFALESDILSKLEHPNIVGYRGHGLTKDGDPYLAMEWVDGDDLDKHLEQGTLAVEEALRVGRAVADALAAAHAAGVIHRDLKPSNVILTRERRAVKLVDFGIARSASVDGLTRTGQAVGTPGYMSPEQARGHVVDARTDLFSLGCLLFRCLGGRRPFAGSDIMQFATSLALEQPPLLREIAPLVPPGLEALVAQLLQKDPALRPESATHVKQAIDRITAGTDRTELAPTEAFASAPAIAAAERAELESGATLAAPTKPAARTPTTDGAITPREPDSTLPATKPAAGRTTSAAEVPRDASTAPAETRRSAEPATRSPVMLGLAGAAIVALLGGAALLARGGGSSGVAAGDADARDAVAPVVLTADAAPAADRAALHRACKSWAGALLKGQRSDGSFAGEERANPSGWDTAQQLFALAEAHRACDGAPVSALGAGARALAMLHVDGGWLGPRRDVPTKADKLAETAAGAWATLALDATAAATKDPATAEAAKRARTELVRAWNGDGGFRVRAADTTGSALYPTALAAWALGREAPQGDAAFEWLDAAVRNRLGGTREVGFSEQLAWIVQRRRPATPEPRSVEVVLLANELITHCVPNGAGLCARPTYETGHVPYLADGGGSLVTPWHPWTTLAATTLAKNEGFDADTRKQLDDIARWGTRELTASADVLGAAPAYKLSEYLIAISELLLAR